MLEIRFEQPFDFRMEVVETDDHVPSMRVDTKIVIPQFQHALSYQGTFWLECSTWTSFLDALSGDLSNQPAVLQDSNAYFMLKIWVDKRVRTLLWEFKKADVGGGRSVIATFSAAIDDSVLARIMTEFAEFPAWW